MKVYRISIFLALTAITGLVTAYPSKVTVKNNSDLDLVFQVHVAKSKKIEFTAIASHHHAEFRYPEETYSKIVAFDYNKVNKLPTFNFSPEATGEIILMYTGNGFKQIPQEDFDASHRLDTQFRLKHGTQARKKYPNEITIYNNTPDSPIFQLDLVDLFDVIPPGQELHNMTPYESRTISDKRDEENPDRFVWAYIASIASENDPKIIHELKLENTTSETLFLIYSKDGFKVVTEKEWKAQAKK